MVDEYTVNFPFGKDNKKLKHVEPTDGFYKSMEEKASPRVNRHPSFANLNHPS